MYCYSNIGNFGIPKYRTFYICSFQISIPTRKFNILQRIESGVQNFE